MAGIIESLFGGGKEHDNFISERRRLALQAADLQNRQAEQQLAAPDLIRQITTPAGASVNPMTGEPLSAPEVGNMSPEQEQRFNFGQMAAALEPSSPGITAGALLQAEGGIRKPADLVMMESLGIPKTEEGYARFKGLSDSGANLDDILKGLQIRELVNDNNDRLAELTELQKERELTEAESRDQALTTAETLNTLWGTLETLEGSLIEPGTGEMVRSVGKSASGVMRWVGNILGNEELQSYGDVLTADNVLVKQTANLALQSMARGGASNQFQQRLFEKASAGENMTPTAIKMVTATVAKNLLRQVDREEIDLSPEVRASLEARIKEYSGTPQVFHFKSREEAQEALIGGMFKQTDMVFINGKRIPLKLSEDK